MYYYTSDLHFGHEEVAKKRGFENAKEMGRHIIDSFNKVLTKDDVLMILGDVSCYGYRPQEEIQSIAGHKVLIIGNHDKSLLSHHSFRKCFVDIRENELIKDGGNKIFLAHYPMCEWDGYMKGIYHFYGHIHGRTDGPGLVMRMYPNAVNVDVAVNGYIPRTAADLIRIRTDAYPTDLERLYKMQVRELIAQGVFPQNNNK